MKAFSVARLVMGSVLFGFLSLAQAAPMFTQCNSIPGNGNTGCNILITATDSGLTIQVDAAAPGFGGEDQFVAVVNNSSSSLARIFLSATTDIFGFDQDGTFGFTVACSSILAGCDYAPGNGSVTFSGFNAALTSGFVNFTGGLAAGGTALFELENIVTASQIIVTPGGVPEPGSIALIGLGLLGLTVARRKAVRK